LYFRWMVCCCRKKKTVAFWATVFFTFLDSADVLGARALFALHDLKGDFIANLELVECHAVQVLGMEEKVLRFAFASDETESPIR